MGVIEDGTGKGFMARVSEDNRLSTISESLPGGVFAAAQRKLWAVTTGDLTLTSDSASAALWVRYTGSRQLVIPRLVYQFGTSTGGSGNAAVTTYRNGTDGTIVTDASQAEVDNRNFAGTATGLSGSQYKGGEGKTLTGGDGGIGTVRTSSTFLVLDESQNPFVLEAGNSIGFTVTPPTGNTSQVARIFLLAYELVLEA